MVELTVTLLIFFLIGFGLSKGVLPIFIRRAIRHKSYLINDEKIDHDLTSVADMYHCNTLVTLCLIGIFPFVLIFGIAYETVASVYFARWNIKTYDKMIYKWLV